jgi:hypothetical protein
MSKVHSIFSFENIQIKSIEKAALFAELLDKMEKEFGIKTCKIKFSKCFICPDISGYELDSLNKTCMERNIREIIKQLR